MNMVRRSGLMVPRKAHPDELRERAVKMVFEVRAETGSACRAVPRVGHQLGINTETLRSGLDNFVRQIINADSRAPTHGIST